MGTWKLSTLASAALWFVWGYSFSIPFYLPPSLYALAKGGVDSSATIADGKFHRSSVGSGLDESVLCLQKYALCDCLIVFDIGGFGLLAMFNAYVADINHAKLAAWIPTFQITTGCAFVALLCLTTAILLETPSSEKTS